MALVLFQLGLKALEQGEGVGRGTGKTGQHPAMVELAHLARRALDDDIAQRDLTVAANGDLDSQRRLAPHADNGGSVKLFHKTLMWLAPAQIARAMILACSLMPMT